MNCVKEGEGQPPPPVKEMSDYFKRQLDMPEKRCPNYDEE